ELKYGSPWPEHVRLAGDSHSLGSVDTLGQHAFPGTRTLSDAAALVVQRARAVTAPAPMQSRVVAIDGPGGAGKSVLAAKVAAALNAQVVCTDDFASWERPLEWWPRLIEQVLGPLSCNQ